MMRWLKTICHELAGLFIDDGRFAATICVWLVLTWQVLPRLSVQATWRAPILLVGLLVILLQSVLRHARQRVSDNGSHPPPAS